MEENTWFMLFAGAGIGFMLAVVLYELCERYEIRRRR